MQREVPPALARLASPVRRDIDDRLGLRVATVHLARREVRAIRASVGQTTLANPYIAAERAYVDAVIAPHETRIEVVRSLRLLRTKRETLPSKKHGNIPL